MSTKKIVTKRVAISQPRTSPSEPHEDPALEQKASDAPPDPVPSQPDPPPADDGADDGGDLEVSSEPEESEPEESEPEESEPGPSAFFHSIAEDLITVGDDLEEAFKSKDKRAVKEVLADITQMRKGLMDLKKTLTEALKEL